MDAFLQLVQLSLVCRQWSQCLRIPMCRTAIIEYRVVPCQAPGASTDPSYKWVSNIGFIAARGMTRKTTSLYISDAHGKGSSSFMAAMNALQFGSNSWDAVELLRLDRCTFMDSQVTDPDMANTIFSLLTSSLHSITEVDYPIDDGSHTQGITLRAMLIKHYMPYSTTVHIKELYLSASLRLLRQDITSLDINTRFIAHPSTFSQLPCSSLQCLRITGVNSGFSWRWFTRDANEPQIVFPELRRLALEFIVTREEMGTDSFIALGLKFPNLQRLSAVNALVHFPDFYAAFTNSPLVSLHIAEMKSHMGHIDPSPIISVQKLKVRPIECKSVPFFLLNPYSNLLPARLSTLSASLAAIRPSELLRTNWIDLQRLELDLSSLYYRSLDVLLIRLPSLLHLSVRYLTYSWYTVEHYEPHNSRPDSPFNQLSRTLQYVSLDVDDKFLHQMTVKWLCNLVRRTPSLLALAIPTECVDEIDQLIKSSEKDISIFNIARRQVTNI